MSVIAWDGEVLAADKLATRGDILYTTTKIFKIGADAVGTTHCLTSGLKLIGWYKAGAKPEEFPKLNKDTDYAMLIVVNREGVRHYEAEPVGIPITDPFFAWGSGSEFAIGAMAMGASAIQAVEIASKHCSGCGRGVDHIRINGSGI